MIFFRGDSDDDSCDDDDDSCDDDDIEKENKRLEEEAMINTGKVVIDIEGPEDDGPVKKDKNNGRKRKTVSDTLSAGGK